MVRFLFQIIESNPGSNPSPLRVVYLHNAFLMAMLHNANTEKLPQECTPFLPVFISKDKAVEETRAITVGRKTSEPRPDLTSFEEDSPSLDENRSHNPPGSTPAPIQVKKLTVKRIITPATLHCTRVPLTLKRKRSLVGATPTSSYSSFIAHSSSDTYPSHSNLNMYHHPMMMIESNQMGIRKLLEITRSKLMRSNCKLSGQKAAALASQLSKCTSRRQHLAKHKMHYVLLRNPASLSTRPRPIQALARRAHLQTLPLLVRSTVTTKTNSSSSNPGPHPPVQGNPKGTCAWIKTGAVEMGSILPMHPLPYPNATLRPSSPGTSWTTTTPPSRTGTNHHTSGPVSSPPPRSRDALPSVESIFFTLQSGAARQELSGSTKKAAQVLTKAVEVRRLVVYVLGHRGNNLFHDKT